MKITRIPVLVTMGRDTGNMCPTEVYAHEVDIYRLVRGDDKVHFERELDPKLYNMGPYEVDSREELIHLKNKFQGFQDEHKANPVDAVYPDGSRDLEAFYKNYGKPQVESPAPVVTPPTDEGEQKEETPKVKSRKEIVEELMAMDVSFPKTAPTQQLAAMLSEIKAGQADKDE